MYNPEEDCNAMIETIKKLCKERNITPNAVAKEAGLSTSTISYLMNGKTKPNMYTILMICNVLDISVCDLFENKGKHEFYLKSGEDEISELIDIYCGLSSEKRELAKRFIKMLKSM